MGPELSASTDISVSRLVEELLQELFVLALVAWIVPCPSIGFACSEAVKDADIGFSWGKFSFSLVSVRIVTPAPY